jgi:vesicle-fusing ATPase
MLGFMLQVLKELDVFDPADVDHAVTALDEEIPIKRLLMLIEMAAQGGDEGADVYKGGQKIELAHLLECLQRINA